MMAFISWLGEDLSVYDEDKDLREVDIPVIKNMVKGYAAYVISYPVLHFGMLC
jgi:hypothetical protein